MAAIMEGSPVVIDQTGPYYHGQPWPGWGYRWLCADVVCRLRHRAGSWKQFRADAVTGAWDHHRVIHGGVA